MEVEQLLKKCGRLIFSEGAGANELQFFSDPPFFHTNMNQQSWPKYTKYYTTGKVQFQFLNSFSLVLTKFSFWQEDWALRYNSMKIWDLLNIS